MPQAQNPIRILFVCHDAGLYGSQQSLLQIVSNLAQDDRFQVFVSVARSGPFVDRLKTLETVTVLKHKRLQWVKHDPRSVFQKLGDLVSLAIGVIYRPNDLVKHIENHQIDLVHSNSMVSLEGAVAANRCSVPHVWHIRELFMTQNPKLNTILAKKTTQKIIGNHAEKVVCISEMVQSQFEIDHKNDSDKFPVLYNAIDFNNADHDQSEQNITLPPKQKKCRLGYIGRISKGKQLDALLQALDEVNPDLDAEVLVAGDYVDESYKKEIKKILKKRTSAVPVHFLGHISTLKPLYESLDVLIVPSRNEPFGRVVIEAASFNVPTIGENSGGLPEIITHGETGWLYPEGHLESLGDRIEDVVNDPDWTKQVGENAGRMVRDRFTMERQMAQLTDIYRDVIPDHPAW